jgi:hypothetical protein
MLGHDAYYYGITRKCIVAFGNIFKDIVIVRNDAEGNRIQVVKVPLAYAGKEKWIQRLEQDANPDAQNVGFTLPRLSFEILGMTYDPTRKVNSVNRLIKSTSTTNKSVNRMFAPVPYNIDLALYSITKTQEDALKIVEQILPFFTPQYTVNIKSVPEFDIVSDVPIILQNVTLSDEYEGDMMSNRVITYTFNFTMKAYLFGPISGQNVITKVDANINDTTDPAKNYASYTATPKPSSLTPDSTNFDVNESWDESF